ncbi:hypothetical protein GGI07_003611 [Coemansia sp. Benny D115]|nr:hypothetical protein GGI07_003611 [Coemansia sp. Benny D115]
MKEDLARAGLMEAIEQAGGTVSPKLRILIPPSGVRGVFVSQKDLLELQSNLEPLLSIPAQQIITADEAMQSDVVQRCVAKLSQEGIPVSESTVLSLFLLSERALGSRSTWGWYLETLPKSGTGALFLNEDELSALDATPLKAAANGKLRVLHRQYSCVADVLEAWICSHGAGTETVGFEIFKWAEFVVLSRAISLKSFAETDGGGSSSASACDRALVPMLDMFNHNATPSAFWAVSDDGSVLVYTSKDSKHPDAVVDDAGLVELCFSYGEKSNTEWMYEHGFVPQGNQHSTWPYLPMPSGTSEFVAIKRMWISELGISPRVDFADPESTGDGPSDHGKGHNYLNRGSLLTMCLAELDDTPGTPCADALGVVTLDPPYFCVGGGELIDDDDKLLSVPGLQKFALHQCIGQLEKSHETMSANAMLLSEARACAVKEYLFSECSLLERVVASIKETALAL